MTPINSFTLEFCNFILSEYYCREILLYETTKLFINLLLWFYVAQVYIYSSTTQ